MPYHTTWEDRGILWEYHGDVAAWEIDQANADFYSDMRSDRTRYQIIDTRAVESVDWSEQNVKRTAGYDLGAARTLQNIKVAYIATDPELVAMFEQYATTLQRFNVTWQVRGFTEMESARAWALS